MAGKSVTRADLSEAVYQKVGLSRTESSALVESVLSEICDCLAPGEAVALAASGARGGRRAEGRRVAARSGGARRIGALRDLRLPRPGRDREAVVLRVLRGPRQGPA